MSDEAQPPDITERLKELLGEAHKHISPPKEQTLFSLGGRGYYENPASDILRFFLTPDAEHGFKALFLKAFFDCMGVDCSMLRFEGVTVVREEDRIDLLVKGQDWVLVIENKIRHIQNNPWDTYEASARRSGKKHYFAILSPDGTSEAPEQWKPVSYKRYCETLRTAFAEAVFDFPYSKWLVFAREFIIHLQTELYNPAMSLDQKQIEFVEQHLPEMEQVKKLSQDYTEFLRRNLEKRLCKAIPRHQFGAWDAGYALKCKDNELHVWEFDFKTPAHTVPNGKFHFTVWRMHLTQEQCLLAQDILSGMKHGRSGRTWDSWSTDEGFDDRTKALDDLCRIAGLLGDLWKDEVQPPSPVPPHVHVETTTTSEV